MEDLPMVLAGGTPPLAVHAAGGQPPAVEPGTLAGPLVTLEQAMSEAPKTIEPPGPLSDTDSAVPVRLRPHATKFTFLYACSSLATRGIPERRTQSDNKRGTDNASDLIMYSENT